MDTKKLTKLDEEFVCNELSLLGFDVKKIKCSEEDERPDFIVKNDSVSYLIELKPTFNLEVQQKKKRLQLVF